MVENGPQSAPAELLVTWQQMMNYACVNVSLLPVPVFSVTTLIMGGMDEPGDEKTSEGSIEGV